VTKPSRQPVLDDVTNLRTAGSNARHRRDMIGFERMLHSQNKAEPQNSEHTLPDFVGLLLSESGLTTLADFARIRSVPSTKA
jgi:hypothetical protein